MLLQAFHNLTILTGSGDRLLRRMRLLRFLLITAKHIFASIMAKANKYGARLLNLVVNLFVLTVCLIIITSMLFVAVWMRLAAGDRSAGYGKTSSSAAVTESARND